MIRVDNEQGYTLKPREGFDLAILVEGNCENRTKEVTIPAEGTLHEWVEVPELPPVEPEPIDEKAERIAQLERELQSLKEA